MVLELAYISLHSVFQDFDVDAAVILCCWSFELSIPRIISTPSPLLHMAWQTRQCHLSDQSGLLFTTTPPLRPNSVTTAACGRAGVFRIFTESPHRMTGACQSPPEGLQKGKVPPVGNGLPGPGGGATHSLGVGTNCETTASTFWQWTAPRF